MLDNKQDINIRLKESRLALGVSSGEFAKKADIDPRNYSSIETGKRTVGERVLRDVCSAFPINLKWLMTGKGEMLKNTSVEITPTISDKSGIPFYDIDVSASIVESFSDIREEAAYYINYPPLKDCTAAFPVYGDSMIPDFIAGDVIIVKRITNINSMLWGEPYLVIANANCDNLRTLKNVYISDDRTQFILRASNPQYIGDTIIPCEDVITIFLVKGKVNRRQL